MGNTPPIRILNSFLIERIITPQIYIGVKAGGKQALKWKDEYYPLEGCQEFDDSIIYQFENQHFLEFSKGVDGIINYTITTPTEKQIGQVSDIIRKNYKTIGMNSNELDKIYRLFQS